MKDENNLSYAIKMVGKSKDEGMVNNLLDYLMGEMDGIPKEPIWTFKLYLELNNYKQASKIAIIIVSNELDLGN